MTDKLLFLMHEFRKRVNPENVFNTTCKFEYEYRRNNFTPPEVLSCYSNQEEHFNDFAEKVTIKESHVFPHSELRVVLKYHNQETIYSLSYIFNLTIFHFEDIGGSFYEHVISIISCILTKLVLGAHKL